MFMATYVSVAKVSPSSARILSVTDVAAGDRIDLTAALGRPATKVEFYMTDTGDELSYTLNSLKKLRTNRRDEGELLLSDAEGLYGTYGTEVIDVWSGSAKYPAIEETGLIEHETDDGISIHSIQINSLTLSVGTTISLMAW